LLSFIAPSGTLTVLEMVRRLIAKRCGPEWAEIPPIKLLLNARADEVEIVDGSSRILDAMPKYKAARNELLTALARGKLRARLENNLEVTPIYWETGSAYEAIESGRIPDSAGIPLELSRPGGTPFFVDADLFEIWLTQIDPNGTIRVPPSHPDPDADPSISKTSAELVGEGSENKSDELAEWIFAQHPRDGSDPKTRQNLMNSARKVPLQFSTEKFNKAYGAVYASKAVRPTKGGWPLREPYRSRLVSAQK
jgi:hypothetical protein